LTAEVGPFALLSRRHSGSATHPPNAHTQQIKYKSPKGTIESVEERKRETKRESKKSQHLLSIALMIIRLLACGGVYLLLKPLLHLPFSLGLRSMLPGHLAPGVQTKQVIRSISTWFLATLMLFTFKAHHVSTRAPLSSFLFLPTLTKPSFKQAVLLLPNLTK